MQPILDRFEGCLVGLALGDALGAPYEFRKGPVPGVTAYFKTGHFGTKPGAPTDDSALAKMLAQSLVGKHGLDRDDYMGRLSDWLRTRPPDVGNQTGNAIRAWRNGRAMAPNEDACGNGSLMACAPLGLYYAGAGLRAATAGETFSDFTHPSSRSRRAVGFFCQSIARLVVDSNEPPPLEMQVRDLVVEPDGPQQGFVLLTAHLAYKTAGSIDHAGQAVDALLDLIRLGGDTDTNAAVAGALIGARFGLAAWPEELTAPLALYSDMLSLAIDLHDLAANTVRR